MCVYVPSCVRRAVCVRVGKVGGVCEGGKGGVVGLRARCSGDMYMSRVCEAAASSVGRRVARASGC